MLFSEIMNKNDLNEVLKLQKRKQFEEDRKKRIFNAKNRLFGLDVDTLERQIAEKKKQRQLAEECERRYEDLTQQQQHMVFAHSLDAEKRKRVIETDTNFYRCRFQRKDQRREFDLNDPDWLKKTPPIRIADDDIRLGISSAQVFTGEDLGKRERKRRQCEQQRAWLDQQMQERQQAEDARRKADHMLDESIHSRDKRLQDLANSQRRVRYQMNEAVLKYNYDLAKIKSAERQREKLEKNEDDMAEIYNMLTSDMLTENPDVAQSRLDPNKKIAFMYRGMSADELAKFRKEQNRQKISVGKRHAEEQLIERQWDQYALNLDRDIMLKHNELDAQRRDKQTENIKYNIDLAVGQQKQNDYNNKIQYKNEISKDFYEQFNRNTR